MSPRERLEEALSRIEPVKEEFLRKAQERLDRLTKPRGSLGMLEKLAQHYVAIKEDLSPCLRRKAVYVFAADHGITSQGISAYPKDVTYQMVLNFLKGGAAINVIARHVGAEVMVVDIGVDHEFEPSGGLIIRKVRRGTADISQGPAMSRAEALQAMAAGFELALEAANGGVDVLATGDMGIGNTTPSSAIASALTGRAPEEVTGRGTGIDEAGWARKVQVVKKALEVNRPNPGDPVDLLAKVGGLEIAGLSGLIIGGAACRISVIVDGFIATAAAALAVGLSSAIKDYLILSHRSTEPGHGALIELMGLEPLFDLSLRLGEGTGAALAMGFLEVALKLFNEMATFEEAGVSERQGEGRRDKR
ncbi:MAG: nicotinate-nucleotide--dimethylbenzimidazole phosphoribosyltransferase [Candidatus Methylomirabilales bacterium]